MRAGQSKCINAGIEIVLNTMCYGRFEKCAGTGVPNSHASQLVHQHTPPVAVITTGDSNSKEPSIKQILNSSNFSRR